MALGLIKPEVFLGFLRNSKIKIKWLRERFNY